VFHSRAVLTALLDLAENGDQRNQVMAEEGARAYVSDLFPFENFQEGPKMLTYPCFGFSTRQDVAFEH
jgi:hypothetical protein